MSRFLQNVINRHLGTEPRVEPRPRSLFEPSQDRASVLPNFSPANFQDKEQTENNSGTDLPNHSSPGNNLHPHPTPTRQSDTIEDRQGVKNTATDPEDIASRIRLGLSELPVPSVDSPQSREIKDLPIIPLENFSRQENETVPTPERKLKPSGSLNSPDPQGTAEQPPETQFSNSRSDPTSAISRFFAWTSEASGKMLTPPNGDRDATASLAQYVKNLPVEDKDHASPPNIKINIGRIEIKAVSPPANQPKKAPQPHRPKMSLDQYLKDRESK